MSSNKANQSKKTGDELFIVESGIAEKDVKDALQDTSKVSGLQIEDGLRKSFGTFWTRRGGKQTFFNKMSDMTPVSHIEVGSGSLIDDETIEYELKVQFRPGRHSSLDIQELEKFFNENEEFTRSFTDHATVINIYEEGNNKVEQAAGILNLYAEISSDYNFLERKYEEFVSANTGLIRELDLPNFYNFILREGESSTRQRTDRSSILSMGGRIRLADTSGLTSEKKNPTSDYFKKWSENFMDYKNDLVDFTKNSSMKEISFTKKETDKLDELYKYKESFPMFNTIEFNVETDGKFGKTLEETNFSSQLRAHMTEDNAGVLQTYEMRMNKAETLTVNDYGQEAFTDSSATATDTLESRIIFDVERVMNKYTNRRVEGLSFNDDILDGEQYRAYYNLMSLIVKGRIKKIKNQVFRNFKEIMEGQTAYSEPVFYKIEKRDQENTLLQTFHFTNMDELDVIKFVDTQVKYDTRYKYTIKSMNLVIGTEYSYSHSRMISEDMLGVKVRCRPTAKIIEVPVFEKSVLIYDNPPIAPELLLIPFKGVNDKIRFFFNSAIGRHMAEPITFSNEEEDLITKFKVAQDIPSEQTEIMFETDDSVSEFILYKLEQPPQSYQDFEDFGESIIVSTSSRSLSAPLQAQMKGTSSAAYDDSIKPNKKYYYCLRAIDYHGNISYPSVVYELEMVDDTGSIYPVSKIYEFEKKTDKQPRMGVKRFIHIKPTLSNLLTDRERMAISETDGPEIGQQVYLGISDMESTWGKKFKLRLTSKSTGKKVDFNFSFDYKQNELKIEE